MTMTMSDYDYDDLDDDDDDDQKYFRKILQDLFICVFFPVK